MIRNRGGTVEGKNKYYDCVVIGLSALFSYQNFFLRLLIIFFGIRYYKPVAELIPKIIIIWYR